MRKKMRKALALLLALSMVTSLLHLTALAVGEDGDHCAACGGTGRVQAECWDCSGNGFRMTNCPTCGGRQWVTCEGCGGEGYTWVEGREETCPECEEGLIEDETCWHCEGSGVIYVEEEWLSCEVCGGNGGFWETPPDCGECSGTGEVQRECWSCRGTGTVLRYCDDCYGTGVATLTEVTSGEELLAAIERGDRFILMRRTGDRFEIDGDVILTSHGVPITIAFGSWDSQLYVTGNLRLEDITLICDIMYIEIEGGSMTMGEGVTLKQVETVVSGGGTFTMTGGLIDGCDGELSTGVRVDDGGRFTMTGGVITGCNGGDCDGAVNLEGGTFHMYGGEIRENPASGGAAVSVKEEGSTFTMEGGSISDNSGVISGGVFLANSGIFTMNGGEIKNNTSGIFTHGDIPFAIGGGMTIMGGTFTMNGGEITGNRVVSEQFRTYGGGVCSLMGNVIMNGGKIADNSADYGGAVSLGVRPLLDGYGENDQDLLNGLEELGSVSTLTMNGGEITGNTADNGGGVYVGTGCTFTMKEGSTISGSDGDGVSVDMLGTFTMEGGEIKDNEERGVFNNGGTFTMEDGVISGNMNTGVYNSASYTRNSEDEWVEVGGVFEMKGGAITRNSGGEVGGIKNCGSGHVTLHSGVQICNNTAEMGGADIGNVGEDDTWMVVPAIPEDCEWTLDGCGHKVTGWYFEAFDRRLEPGDEGRDIEEFFFWNGESAQGGPCNDQNEGVAHYVEFEETGVELDGTFLLKAAHGYIDDAPSGGDEGGNEGGGTTPTPTPTYYTLTVRYVDAEGEPVADSYTQRLRSGQSYRVVSPEVEGCTPDQEAVTGTLFGNTTLTVTYAAVEEMEETQPPVTEEPETTEPVEPSEPAETQEPGETEDPGEEDLGEVEPPLAEAPDVEPEEELGETDIPLAEVPQTGDDLALWLILTILSAAGLVLIALTEKKGRRVAR